ncbi:peptidylprolyl isomerase [Aliikangiella sp. G2MR2-5]|uniref:peptidylprolyl isomerase n=1 Tax=Aliikangiella sp. G2MR2-5 TaxID=2788943 RepID=UPI0018AA691C|nr:peptidylprolyl isomerase [Aliikangiella sp. G2MR2-5]
MKRTHSNLSLICLSFCSAARSSALRLIITSLLLASNQLWAQPSDFQPRLEADASDPKSLHSGQTTSDQSEIIQQIYQLVDDRNPDLEFFAKVLQSKDIHVVNSAIVGLGRIGGKAVISSLIPFLKDDNPILRQHAAFALGLTANKESAHYLWQRLEEENDDLVKHEIYLGLGNLGQNNLVSRMLKRLTQEKSRTAQASLFQGLAIALTFHRELVDDYATIDYQRLLSLFAVGDDLAARVGYFLSRIPGIEKRIQSAQLTSLISKPMSPLARNVLSRLIGKVSAEDKTQNRELLAWLIEQTENGNLNERIAAIGAMRNMLDIPQALIQLGKLQASEHPLIAQTALNVLASSEQKDANLISLFKNQLKSEQDAMVVEALKGLVKRQTKNEMSWVVKLFKHPSAYVKIQLLTLLNNKKEEDFSNLIQFFSGDPDPRVSKFAKSLLAKEEEKPESRADSPSFAQVKQVIGKKVTLSTTAGDFTIELLADAPYTAWHFVNNAKEGHFNNSYFSRVIGNFVAQGGDTIGNGNGSSGKTIREEISFLKHEPMTVAMATSGKDTATSQFYINTARNLHLDRNYSIFGKIVDGQDVVYRMIHGTMVKSVTVTN